jgi:hypothetical protein
MAVNVCYKIPFLNHQFKTMQFFNGQIDSNGNYHFDPITRPLNYQPESLPPEIFNC